MGLSAEQENTLIRLLQMCEPGKMSLELFLEFCRLLPMVAIEVVTLRRGEERTIEVLLTQRPANDPHFPNEWHSPGTILRVTDFADITPGELRHQTEQFSRAFERLGRTELGAMPFALDFAGMVAQPSPRGPHLHLIFINPTSPATSPAGNYFAIERLPEPFMAAHRSVLELALQKFNTLY